MRVMMASRFSSASGYAAEEAIPPATGRTRGSGRLRVCAGCSVLGGGVGSAVLLRFFFVIGGFAKHSV